MRCHGADGWLIGSATVLAIACSAGSGGGSAGPGAPGGTGGASGTLLTGGTAGTAGAGGTSVGGSSGTLSFDAAGGTSGAVGEDACAEAIETAEIEVAPVDIIIAVDQSGSMDQETKWVQAQLNGFSTLIKSSGITTLGVVLIAVQPATPSMDINGLGCDVNENPICVPPPLAGASCGNSTEFLNVNCHVDSHDALEKILGLYDQFSSFLHAGAQTHVIVITDDTSDMPVTQFDTAFRALDPNLETYKFHAIYSFSADTFGLPCWNIAANEGTDYRQLVQMRGGVGGDLCAQNFQPVWDAVRQQVIQSTTISCEWEIPPPPDGGVVDPALVNIEFVGNGQLTELGYVGSAAECATHQNAWYFDDNVAPTKVIACSDTCSLVQSEGAVSITLKFGCTRKPAIPK